MPFGQIFNQGVRYIKVNRFDSGGLDRSDYLGQLTNLTITYDDLGPIEYIINTTQEQDTYFVYEIQTRNQSTSSVNYEVLDYKLTASKTVGFSISTKQTLELTNYDIETIDVLNAFNTSSGYYTFPITPNIPIVISASCNLTAVSTNQDYIFFFSTQERFVGNSSTSIGISGSITAGSSQTINLNGVLTLDSNPIENSSYRLYIAKDNNGGTLSLNNASLTITQSSTPNPATSSLIIFDPEFIDFEYNDYNAIYGNAEVPQFSFQFMDVDYTTDFTAPINFDLIISGTADRALVQDSNYTSEAWSNLRYNGVKSEAPDFNQLTTEGGLGFEPNVEQNKTFLAYFDNVYGTGPELIGQTAYNVKYLIDTNGAVSNPEPGLPALYNIIDSFESGKNAVVRLIDNDPLLTQNPNDDALTGLHPITSVGRISSILVTETGSKIPDYVPTMSFTDVNGNQLQPDVVNFIGSVNISNDIDLNFTPFGFQAIPFDANYQQPPLSPIWGQAGQFNAPNGTYTFNSSSIEGRTDVFLNFYINVKNPYNLAQEIKFRVWNYTTNQVIPWTNFFNNPSDVASFTIQGDGQVFLDPAFGDIFILANNNNFNQVCGGTLGPLNINAGDEVGIQYQNTNASPFIPSLFLESNNAQFSIGQVNPPGEIDVDGLNIATSSYWSLGSNEYVGIEAINPRLTTTITASQSLTKLWKTGRKQILPTASAEIGFSPIGLPFSQTLNSPAPGDWIRFEYNKDFRLFNITEVGTTDVNNSGSLYLKLYPAFTSGSIQLDHFVMYRILNDGTYVILDIDKPVSGSSFTGVIQPEYVSQELIDKYSDIIQDLTQKGLIS
jgi:hypothetical protein